MDVVELFDAADEAPDDGIVTSVGFVGSKIEVIDVLEVDEVVNPYEPPADEGAVEMAVGAELPVELGVELEGVDPDVVDPLELEVSFTDELDVEVEPEVAVDGAVTDDIEVLDEGVPDPPTGAVADEDAVADVDFEVESLELEVDAEDVGATTGPVEPVGLPELPTP